VRAAKLGEATTKTKGRGVVAPALPLTPYSPNDLEEVFSEVRTARSKWDEKAETTLRMEPTMVSVGQS
jgi:hypothetical protein